jgi:hypothetical protein
MASRPHTSEVAAVVRWCYEHDVAIVPRRDVSIVVHRVD